MENKKNERQLQINRLQQNLSSIRKIAGWSAETLGNKIGVTKQTISNLENKKTPMTFTQYIAIRAVLDAEIETNKDNEALPKVISILLDSVDSIDDNEYKEVQKSVERQNERRANLEAKSDAELKAIIQNNSFLASEAEKDVARAILRRRGY